MMFKPTIILFDSIDSHAKVIMKRIEQELGADSERIGGLVKKDTMPKLG